MIESRESDLLGNGLWGIVAALTEATGSAGGLFGTTSTESTASAGGFHSIGNLSLNSRARSPRGRRKRRGQML
jgi:hypothetical protein